MHLPTRTWLLFLPALALPAQDTLRPPADCLVVAEFDGPARWRESFADTNLGRWLASPAVTRHLAPYWGMLDQALASAPAQDGFDATAAWQAWRAYRGRITVAFDVETSTGGSEDGAPPFWLAVVASGDGRTDLRGLAARLQEFAEREERGRIRDLRVGDRRLRVTGSRDVAVTVPFLCGEDLVLVVARPGDRMLKSFFARAATTTGPTRADANLRVRVHGPRLARLVHHAAARTRGGTPELELVDKCLSHLGVDALANLELVVRAEGPLTSCTATLALTGANPGVFALLRPARQRPALLDLVPRTSRDFGVFAFRASAARAWLAGLLDILEPVSGQGMAEVEAGIAKALGVRLQEDVFAHLGDEVLCHTLARQPEPAGRGRRRAEPLLDDMCIAIEAKNAPALGAALERAFARPELRARSETAGGTKVWQVQLDAVPVHVAVCERALLVAFGARGRTALQEVLAAAGRNGTPQAFPPALAARCDAAQPPVAAIAAADVTQRLEGLLQAAGDGRPNRQVRTLVQFVKPLVASMRAAGLEFVVQAARFEGNTLTVRTTF
jgi:hypothetical protein